MLMMGECPGICLDSVVFFVLSFLGDMPMSGRRMSDVSGRPLTVFDGVHTSWRNTCQTVNIIDGSVSCWKPYSYLKSYGQPGGRSRVRM